MKLMDEWEVIERTFTLKASLQKWSWECDVGFHEPSFGSIGQRVESRKATRYNTPP